jgi:hypothetical protein
MDFKDQDEGREDEGETLHYYFDHDERIKHAPKIVQEYYAGGGPRPVKGLFKNLVSTPANRMGFLSIVVFAGFMLFFSLTSEKPNRKVVSGTEMTLSAFSYDDEVYVSLKATPLTGKESRKKPSHIGPVLVKFTAVDNQKGTAAVSEMKELYNGSELAVRTKFSDYDIVKVKAEVKFDGEEKELTAAVEKR